MDTELYKGIKIAEAKEIQEKLRSQIDIAERKLNVSIIGGADISLNLYSTTVYAGIVLLHFPSLQPFACSLIKAETRFPYVPGYLAFREVPALMKAYELLPKKPDVVVVDGHGMAHPRRMGIATHFGLIANQATMGCAKKVLTGKFVEPPLMQDTFSPLYDKDEQIGYAYRSKFKVKPVFISPGHLLGMNNALALIKNCTGMYRIPEPTRLAHEFVNKFRKGELEEGFHNL